MSCHLLIVSQSDYLIQVVGTNSHAKLQTVQIQISWLLKKPTDLDLHSLQRQGLSKISRTRVKSIIILFLVTCLVTIFLHIVLASSGIDYDIKIWAPLLNKPFFDEERANEVNLNAFLLDILSGLFFLFLPGSIPYPVLLHKKQCCTLLTAVH